MDEYLKLNDGTILANGKAYDDGTGLNLILPGESINLLRAAELLFSPENTKKITYHYYKAELEFIDFTHLKSVSEDGQMITARLLKGANTDEGRDLA